MLCVNMYNIVGSYGLKKLGPVILVKVFLLVKHIER